MSELLRNLAQQLLADPAPQQAAPEQAPMQGPPAAAEPQPAPQEPAVDMSQVPASAPPAPQEAPAPFNAPPQRQVPVTNTGGVTYTQQSQDDRAVANRDFTTAKNLYAESARLGREAEEAGVAQKTQEAELKAPMLDEAATQAHEQQQATLRTSEYYGRDLDELRGQTSEMMKLARESVGAKPTNLWDSPDTRQKAMGILGVILAAPAGAPQMMASLNNLLSVNSAEQAAYQERLHNYGLMIDKAGTSINQQITDRKALMELNNASTKEYIARQGEAIERRMQPGAAKVAAQQNIAKIYESAAKSLDAVVAHQAEANAKTDEHDIMRDEAQSKRLAALAENFKAQHAGSENFLPSSEAAPTNAPGYDKTILTEKPREKIVAAQEGLNGLNRIEKMLEHPETGLAGRFGAKTLREAQIEMQSLIPAIGTASGLTRHDPHTLERLQQQFGLDLRSIATNKATGIETLDLIRRTQHRLAETIDLEYKQANPTSQLSKGGLAYGVMENEKQRDTSMREVHDITHDKQQSKAWKYNELVKLAQKGNIYAKQAIRDLK